MRISKNNTVIKSMTLAIGCSLLVACSATDRISQIGQAPKMSAISSPATEPEYQPVSLPMPTQDVTPPQKNSLWQGGRTTFFKDQRASDIGDIITVLIDIEDEATIDNASERTRSSGEDAALGSLIGLEQSLDRVFPQAIDNTNLTDLSANSTHSGSGSIEREDEISLRMAALINQVLPNGNMVIHGKQEVLVNFEKRILMIDGVIRPQDISVDNTVSYDQIAEARIVYGGEGQITDMQQPRYGQQLYDIIFPF